MNPIPSQANTRTRTLIARADSTPIVAGTVNYYLLANTGTNAGKWFKTSDNSWDDSESIAAAMSHKADGVWSCSVDAEAWPTSGVEYTEYAKESGDLHVPMSQEIRCESSGSGSGARTVAVTVDDGADAMENASVRFTEGASTYVVSTNASGLASFSLDDATYAVAITKAGYSFTPTTLVVDGDKTQTYSMTAVTITAPPSATTTTGVMTVYDEEGSVESGVSVSVQILDGPGTDGIGYDSAVWTETSSALGVVSFAGIILGARYKIWRGDSKPLAKTFTAPTTGDAFNLAEVIGRG